MKKSNEIKMITIYIGEAKAATIGIFEDTELKLNKDNKIDDVILISIMKISHQMHVHFKLPSAGVCNRAEVTSYKPKTLAINILIKALSEDIFNMIKTISTLYSSKLVKTLSGYGISGNEIRKYMNSTGTYSDRDIKSVKLTIGLSTLNVLGLELKEFEKDDIDHQSFVTLLDYSKEVLLTTVDNSKFVIKRRTPVDSNIHAEVIVQEHELKNITKMYLNRFIDRAEIVGENEAVIDYQSTSGRMSKIDKCENIIKGIIDGGDATMNIRMINLGELLGMVTNLDCNDEYEKDVKDTEVSKSEELIIIGGLVKAGFKSDITAEIIKEVKLNAGKTSLDEYDYNRFILLSNGMDTPENILAEANSDESIHRIIIKKDGLKYALIEITYNNETIISYDFINNTRNEINKK